MESSTHTLASNVSIDGIPFETGVIEILNTERFSLHGRTTFNGSIRLQVSNTPEIADFVDHPNGHANVIANENFYVKGKSNYRYINFIVEKSGGGTGTLHFLELFTKANDG